MSIQMNAGNGITGTVTLPAPSGATVTLASGIGSVNPQDVPTALAAGWQIMAGQNWPGAQVKHMSPPSTGAWPTTGTVTSPDGQSIAITGGAAVVPIQWVNYYVAFGWRVTAANE